MPGIDGGKEIAEAVGVDFFSAPIQFSVRRVNIDSPSTCSIFKKNTDVKIGGWSCQGCQSNADIEREGGRNDQEGCKAAAGG